MSEPLADQNDDPSVLRRQADYLYLSRFAEMREEIVRLRSSFEASLQAAAIIQSNQTNMFEKIAAFNEKFLEHDRREEADRKILLDSMKEIAETMVKHESVIERHAEAISSLKVWDMLIATSLGAMAAGGVAWIIQHIQSSVIW